MFPYSLLSGWTWYFAAFDTPLNTARSIAIWLSLALFIAYLVCSFVLKSDKRKTFHRAIIPIFIVYVCALCGLFLTLSFLEDGIEPILFIPLFALLCLVGMTAVVISLHRTRMLTLILSIAIGCAFLTTLVCMGIHFASGKAAENNWLTNEDVQSVGLYLVSGIFAIALVCLALFGDTKHRKEFDSKSVTYAAICIAMSFALSFMRLARLPQGGSITPASLLPLMLYAYMFGLRKGIFAGFVYGLLQAFQDPTVLHPAQFLLDYPMAFAWMGLAGVFAQCKTLQKYPQAQFALGGTLAGLGRFCMHFLSGTFAFGVFAPEGTPAALYSFVYQAGYVLPDLAIAITVGIALFSSKAFVKESRKFHTLLKKEV
jgi:thiamine transporter